MKQRVFILPWKRDTLGPYFLTPNLFLQLTGAIKSLDDLTERYEIENSFLEEKVIETMNEVKDVETKV